VTELLRHTLAKGTFLIENESDRYLETVRVQVTFPTGLTVLTDGLGHRLHRARRPVSYERLHASADGPNCNHDCNHDRRLLASIHRLTWALPASSGEVAMVALEREGLAGLPGFSTEGPRSSGRGCRRSGRVGSCGEYALVERGPLVLPGPVGG
jgi:hypothetical protein